MPILINFKILLLFTDALDYGNHFLIIWIHYLYEKA